MLTVYKKRENMEYRPVFSLAMILLSIIYGYGQSGEKSYPTGEKLDSLYTVFVHTEGTSRMETGREIVQLLHEQQFKIDTLLFDKELSSADFERLLTNEAVRYLFRFERYQQTLNAAENLVKLSEAAKDSATLIVGYYFLGFANQRIGEMDEGLKYALMCYELCIAQNDLEMQSSVLNNLGNIYMINGEDSVATHYFSQTISIERKLNRRQNLAIRLGNLATAYKKQGKLHEALAAVTEGLEIDREVGRADKIAVRLHQMGEVLLGLKRYDEAMMYERESLGYFEEEGSNYGMSVTLQSMGEIEETRGNDTSAQNYYKQALSHAEKEENKLLIQRISQRLYYLNRVHNPAEALAYYERYIALRDTVFNADNQRQLNDFRIQYETREKESQIILQQAEIRQAKLHRTLLFVAILFALTIATMLYLLNRQRKKQNRKLSELNATKDKLLSIISHDLKSPIIAQKVALDSIINDSESNTSALQSKLKSFSEATESQLSLVHNLLNWASLQTGRMKCNPTVFNLSDAALKVIDLYTISAQNKNLRLIPDIDKECLVYADKQMINTVIRNLLNNAIKFSMSYSDITISVHCLAENTCLTITDKGVGMSQHQIEDLLIYGKNHSMKDTVGERSSGLGLIVCKDLLEANNSSLIIDSEENKGTSMSFKLQKS